MLSVFLPQLGTTWRFRWRYRYVPTTSGTFYRMCFCQVDKGTGWYVQGSAVLTDYGKDEARLATLAMAMCTTCADMSPVLASTVEATVLDTYAAKARVPGRKHVLGPWQEELARWLDA